MKVALNQLILAVFLSLSVSCVANAGDWKFGGAIAYVSGISDVADIYEENLEAQPFVADADITEIPVGLSFMSRYHGDSGLTFDFGLGPLFVIVGDADHAELPFFGTVGFRFGGDNAVTPYIRGGVSYHIVSGDFDESSTPGAYAGVGLEFGKNNGPNWGVEVGYDSSEVEFENLRTGTTEDINTYDLMVLVFMLF